MFSSSGLSLEAAVDNCPERMHAVDAEAAVETAVDTCPERMDAAD